MKPKQIINAVIRASRGNWEEAYKKIKDKVYPEEQYLNLPTENFICIVDDPLYPDKLKCSPKPPFGLYFEGDIQLIKKNNILFIGDESNSNDAPIKRILNPENKNRVIVTNLNSFNDYDVVKSAISNGNKIILNVANSINAVKKHQSEMCKMILDNGGLILSEYPVELNQKEIEENALKRSQLLTASLSNEMVLLDSTKNNSNSGQIINLGIQLGKDVFVFPCKNLESFNYELLKMGAPLITEAHDLYKEETHESYEESIME